MKFVQNIQIRKNRVSADSFILNTFLMATSNTTCYTNFLIVEFDRSIKRLPIALKENANTLLEIDAL